MVLRRQPIRYNARMQEPLPQIWTVSQVTRRVKTLLETQIGNIWVSGEISNLRVSPSGHAYFTLKDKDSQIDAVIFRSRLAALKFTPENGLEVIVFGLVSVYEKRGAYQIICEEMHPKGLGALQLALERLKKKLEEEGLFDPRHKASIPRFPRRIGIVTSPTGAAIRDILHVIRRRFANMHIILYPARVQGEEAAADIVEAIRYLDQYNVDVIIVGRGGGSLEDLWPFNEESVVRAIHAAKTPIISAVGHEVDFTLSDFAADLRAPTPSAAAELVVQERETVLAGVRDLARRLTKSVQARIKELRHRAAIAKSSYVLQRPEQLVREHRQQLDEFRARITTAMQERLRNWRARVDRSVRSLALLSPAAQVRRASERLSLYRQRLYQAGAGVAIRFRSRLRPLQAELDALSPLAILGRGYAIVWRMPGRHLVRKSDQLAPGNTIAITLGKGGATAIVQTTED